MRILILLVLASPAFADLQADVDGIFDRFLPQQLSMKEVGACHKACGEDVECHKGCSPGAWMRAFQECTEFNASWACHTACGEDVACHFKCPVGKPKTIQELQSLANHMVCHSKCGEDRDCHQQCGNPWVQKQAWCGKLGGVVYCHRQCGMDSDCHTKCPELDNDSMAQFEGEPASLVQDVVDHIIDHLLPADGDGATQDEVKECHMKCAMDIACHKACPSGSWGRLQTQCEVLNATKTCHQNCGEECSCHWECPMTKPGSVKELKDFVDAMFCHTSCGHEDHDCHRACVNPWSHKQAQCDQLQRVKECHMDCATDHDCHASCPVLDPDTMYELQREPTGLTKDLIDHVIFQV